MNAAAAIALQQAFVAILKRKFTNLTVEETTKLAGELVLAVVAAEEQPS